MTRMFSINGGRFTTPRPGLTEVILADIGEERERQEAKFPDQHLAAGTGWTIQRAAALSAARIQNDQGIATWESVLREEFFEALVESNPAALRTELVQVAAVALRFIEEIDRQLLDQPLPEDVFEDVHDLGGEG